MTKMPTLYKTTKLGAIQTYSVRAEAGNVIVTQGQINGKKQTYTTVCTDKNVGKKNLITAKVQALVEATAKYEKKLKSGYTTDPSGVSGVQLPQKVKPYAGNESKVAFPCCSSPKLNGVNATYWLLDDGSLKLTSRGGNEYPPIPHLEESIRFQMRIADTSCLNGELYIHGEHLQDIVSAVKKPKELSKELTFVTFGLPLTGSHYGRTLGILRLLNNDWHKEFNKPCSPSAAKYFTDTKVTTVNIKNISDVEELEAHYVTCMAAGYEGTVITNRDSVYKFNERSNSVFKYKKAVDGEFKVLGFQLDKNKHPVVLLTTPSGLEFKAKAVGTSATKDDLTATLKANTDTELWGKVEYEILSKAGIPLKPVFICLRACNSAGEPNE